MDWQEQESEKERGREKEGESRRKRGDEKEEEGDATEGGFELFRMAPPGKCSFFFEVDGKYVPRVAHRKRETVRVAREERDTELRARKR